MKIIKFQTQSCAPCKMLSPILESISKEFGVEVETINVENDPLMGRKYGVRSVPTLVFEHAGQRTATIIGMTNRKAILHELGIPQ